MSVDGRLRWRHRNLGVCSVPELSQDGLAVFAVTSFVREAQSMTEQLR
jgi:hypothetical protein